MIAGAMRAEDWAGWIAIVIVLAVVLAIGIAIGVAIS